MIWRRWPDFLALRAPKICKDLQNPQLFFCESIARFTALHGELHLHDGAQRDPPKRCLRNFRWQGTMSGSLANARALYFRSLLDPPPIGGLGRHPVEADGLMPAPWAPLLEVTTSRGTPGRAGRRIYTELHDNTRHCHVAPLKHPQTRQHGAHEGRGIAG